MQSHVFADKVQRPEKREALGYSGPYCHICLLYLTLSVLMLRIQYVVCLKRSVNGTRKQTKQKIQVQRPEKRKALSYSDPYYHIYLLYLMLRNIKTRGRFGRCCGTRKKCNAYKVDHLENVKYAITICLFAWRLFIYIYMCIYIYLFIWLWWVRKTSDGGGHYSCGVKSALINRNDMLMSRVTCCSYPVTQNHCLSQ
jgi:hypothetical protein